MNIHTLIVEDTNEISLNSLSNENGTIFIVEDALKFNVTSDPILNLTFKEKSMFKRFIIELGFNYDDWCEFDYCNKHNYMLDKINDISKIVFKVEFVSRNDIFGNIYLNYKILNFEVKS